MHEEAHEYCEDSRLCCRKAGNEWFSDIVVDPSSFLDGGHDGGEIVICQNHVGCALCHISSAFSIAQPISAARRAGASLTPSPVMATISPCA